MKRLTIFLPIALMLTIGCKSASKPTPTQTFTAIEAGEDTVIKAVILAGQNGVLTQADLQKIEPPLETVVNKTFEAEAAYKATTQPSTGANP